MPIVSCDVFTYQNKQAIKFPPECLMNDKSYIYDTKKYSRTYNLYIDLYENDITILKKTLIELYIDTSIAVAKQNIIMILKKYISFDENTNKVIVKMPTITSHFNKNNTYIYFDYNRNNYSEEIYENLKDNSMMQIYKLINYVGIKLDSVNDLSKNNLVTLLENYIERIKYFVIEDYIDQQIVYRGKKIIMGKYNDSNRYIKHMHEIIIIHFEKYRNISIINEEYHGDQTNECDSYEIYYDSNRKIEYFIYGKNNDSKIFINSDYENIQDNNIIRGCDDIAQLRIIAKNLNIEKYSELSKFTLIDKLNQYIEIVSNKIYFNSFVSDVSNNYIENSDNDSGNYNDSDNSDNSNDSDNSDDDDNDSSNYNDSDNSDNSNDSDDSNNSDDSENEYNNNSESDLNSINK